MQRFAQFILVLVLIAAPLTLPAKPKAGFHTGPYLTLEIGAMQVTYDQDQVTSEKMGREFEPTFGFLFGWNFTDALSTELQGLYATNLNADRREHIASANIYGKWTFITNALTSFPTLRILPFAKGGVSVRLSALPGNLASDDSNVPSVGVGPSLGAGLVFLWKKYFYFGVDLQGDFLFLGDINQTVAGVPDTLVYRGGFHPSFAGLGILGVHY